MKYLIDIGHPAHVHYFKNYARLVSNRGAEVLFTCRDKDVTISLLEHYGFNYINFGRNFKSRAGKIFGLIYFTLKLFLVSLKYRPDVYLNATIYSAFTAWILRKLHISLEDTFNKEQVRLYLPFTDCVLTGNYEHPSLGRKEIRYNGYQELLYLHPNHYKPDPGIYQKLGIDYGTPYAIIRFVSWNASHDYGHKGISYENKIKAVREFEKYVSVFISSESELPVELQPYQIKIDPYLMHDAIAFASLIIGESFTMLSEAAMLGTPAVLIHNTKSYYLYDQEVNYGLVFNYCESEDDQLKAINKAIELLKQPGLKNEWKKRRDLMLKDKIDATEFLVWFVESFPESKNILRKNPEYQNRFKDKV
jgi:predicted glycosyltransferase